MGIRHLLASSGNTIGMWEVPREYPCTWLLRPYYSVTSKQEWAGHELLQVIAHIKTQRHSGGDGFYGCAVTWYDSRPHLPAGPGEREADEGTVEERLGEVWVEMSKGCRECCYVVRQKVVGIFYPRIQIAHPVVGLIPHVQLVRMVHQPRPAKYRKHFC